MVSSSVAQTFQALPRDAITPIRQVNVSISVAITRLAKIAGLQRVAKVTVVTSTTMRSSVASGAGVANVAIRTDGVAVIVQGSLKAGGAKIVGGDVQRTLARLAIVGRSSQGISVEALGALLTPLTGRIVLASTTA